MSVQRRFAKFLGLAAVGAISIGLAACSSGGDSGSAGEGDGDLTTVGFVAVGPEGAWREANEKNVQDTFTEDAGFDLKYAPATNLDQKSQIDAFTSFVDEGVDVILLSATEASGWEDSLERAQEAEIPVILLDRGIEPDDDEPLRHPHRARQRRGRRRRSARGLSSSFPTAATTSRSRAPPASAW